MGKSSKPTIGYWHEMGLYMGECAGPADALRAIEIGGEKAWEGSLTASGAISIDLPELFGGEKKEGGIVGVLEVRMGEPDQLPNAYLQAQVPGPWPAARGLVTTVFNGTVGAMNPNIKLWKKKWSRWTAGWRTPVWAPELAKIGEGMNAAHIFYEVVTDTDCGAGYPASQIDTERLLAVAQQLHDEDFGLCLKWARGERVMNFINLVCEHVGATWYEDPATGKLGMTLFRANYDPDDLELIDESNIVELTDWDQPALDGSVNEVVVVGRSCTTNKDISVAYQNVANVQAQGRVVSDKRQLPGLWNDDLLARVAARETIAASSLLPRIKVRVKRDLYGIKRGDVRALSWKRKGVVRMPVRVLEVDEGTLTDSVLTLTLMQDVNGMAATTYVAPVTSGWIPPDNSPKPVPAQRLVEASYRDLAGFLPNAELAAVAEDAGYLVALGARPSGVAYGYELHTRVGSAAFAQVTGGDFSPTGLLSAAIGPTTATWTLTSGRDLSLVQVGTEAMVDEEKMRVTAIDPQTGSVSVARGCVDTVPKAHGAGARMWFTDAYVGADPTEYIEGEAVDARLLTRTSQGVLDLSLATTASLAMIGRQFRPYPPGRLRLNTLVYPASITAASVTAVVADRDRLLQADQLIDTEQTSIGPEPGTTKTFRWYLNDVLARTEAGVTGSSDTYTPAGAGVVRVEVEAVRDGVVSLQALTHTFSYSLP